MKFLALCLSLGTATLCFAADMSFAGYLTDKACGTAGTAPDGSDVVKAPWEHTVACQVTCAGSGYGIMIKDGNAYKFTPFDTKGNELAAQILKTTKKTKGPMIVASGSMLNGVLEVSSLVESNN
jgi:hypothetical protein